jgi:hypothetical protein
MVERKPLAADPSAGVFRDFASSDTIPRSNLPAAAVGQQGAVELASATPAAVASSGSAGSATTVSKSDHVHAHGNQTGGGLHAEAIRLGTAGNVTGTAGFLSARLSNRLDQLGDAGAVVPEEDYPRELVVAGSKLTGTTLKPNVTGTVDPYVQNNLVVHDTAVLYPFMTWTEVDFYGYPHFKYKQMNGTSAANNQVSNGYESGQRFRKGDMLRRPGRGARYEVRGRLRNKVWNSSFIEFVLEPNPVAATYTGANRIRFLSGELNFLTGANDAFVTFWVQLHVESATAYSWEAELNIYSENGALLRTSKWGDYTTSGFNWLLNDCKLQLRWRVDRIENIDTYNATYQGWNQGAVASPNGMVIDAKTTIAATSTGFTDSNTGDGDDFSGLQAGDVIEVRGFTNTALNRTYTVTTSSAGSVTVSPAPAATATAGDTVTIVRRVLYLDMRSLRFIPIGFGPLWNF